MALSDYPIDVRIDQLPEQRSRGWAALGVTIILKLLALLPHAICLLVLGIVQLVVAFVAQIVVAVTGEYPAGMFDFVAGVLRWSTRVSTFFLSLNDRYPPFTLQPDPGYPSDLVIVRPPRSNRLYALFTVIVEVAVAIGVVALIVHFVNTSGSSFAPGGSSLSNFGPRGPSFSSSGLVLRDIVALPHLIVLVVLGLAVAVLWYVAQWVILVTGRYPHSWSDFTTGVVRWQARVSGYTLGLVDRYPPFTFDPSIAAAGPAGPGPPPWSGAPGGYAPWTAPVAPTPPAGWYPDPARRHEYRYWSGVAWTPQVADHGQASVDPLGP